MVGGSGRAPPRAAGSQSASSSSTREAPTRETMPSSVISPITTVATPLHQVESHGHGIERVDQVGDEEDVGSHLERFVGA